MTITRRSFIRNLGVAAVAVVSLNSVGNVFGQSLKSGELFPLPPEMLNDPLNYLTRQHFEPFVDSLARVYTGKKTIVQMRLIEVKALSYEANEKRRITGESFSLLFEDTRQGSEQAAEKMRLPQKSYLVELDALGAFTLFLAPVGLRKNRYEAVINRISPPANN